MTAEQMKRLVDNIRRDGRLTSTVLLYQPKGEEQPEILSGHHRVQAAIEAGIDEIDAHLITTPLSEQRKTAIQLSHNAITGQDDFSILLEMYEDLPLGEKLYSGLTDDDLRKFNSIDIGALGVGAPEYKEISVFFLHSEVPEFEAALERIEKSVKGKSHPAFHLARFEDFNTVFDAVVGTKDAFKVGNSAIALGIMAELALERLDQIESEAD